MGYALYVVISPSDIQPVSSNASPPPHFCEFIFRSKVYKYSRAIQSVYHVSCKSSGSDGIQTGGLTDQHKPLRFTLAMQGIRLEISRQLFVLPFGLFILHTFIFIMFPFFLQHSSLFYSLCFFLFFVIQNYLAGMKQSAINIPTLYTEPVLKHIGLYMLGGRA